VPALIAALRAFPSHSHLCQSSCSALGNLLSWSRWSSPAAAEALRRRCCKQGLPAALLGALSAHGSETGVLEAAGTALGNLASGPFCASAVAAAGAAPVLLACLSSTVAAAAGTGGSRRSEKEQAAEAACYALRSLQEELPAAESAQLLLSAGAMAPLGACLSEFRDCSTVCEEAWFVASHLLAQQQAGAQAQGAGAGAGAGGSACRQAELAGLLPLLVPALSEHPVSERRAPLCSCCASGRLRAARARAHALTH
jgi:hypothetical protein